MKEREKIAEAKDKKRVNRSARVSSRIADKKSRSERDVVREQV